jgi:hypothetical protein
MQGMMIPHLNFPVLEEELGEGRLSARQPFCSSGGEDGGFSEL